MYWMRSHDSERRGPYKWDILSHLYRQSETRMAGEAERETQMKRYLLVEVDVKDESVPAKELRGILSTMLAPTDAHDPVVRVFDLEDVRFEGRKGKDLHQDSEVIEGISNLSVGANFKYTKS